MKMVTVGDDDQRSEEGSRGERRCLDLLALLGSYREEETRSVRTTDECKNQDNASPSSSSSSLSSVESTRRRVTPEWLVTLMRILRGVDAKLVIDKTIQRIDVNAYQGHLLIPFNQIIEMDFLNEAELSIIDEHQRDNNSNRGLDVIVVASDGTKWNAYLRRWDMTCPSYALCSGWNDVVRDTNLESKLGQVLSLWSFRSQDGTKLYLAFFDQPPPRELSPCEAALGRLPKVPKKRRNLLVCAPSPPTAFLNLSQCILDLNKPLVQEMALLEDVQEKHDGGTSVEYITEEMASLEINIPMAPVRMEMASLEAAQETSQESARETTRVDLELIRL